MTTPPRPLPALSTSASAIASTRSITAESHFPGATLTLTQSTPQSSVTHPRLVKLLADQQRKENEEESKSQLQHSPNASRTNLLEGNKKRNLVLSPSATSMSPSTSQQADTSMQSDSNESAIPMVRAANSCPADRSLSLLRSDHSPTSMVDDTLLPFIPFLNNYVSILNSNRPLTKLDLFGLPCQSSFSATEKREAFNSLISTGNRDQFICYHTCHPCALLVPFTTKSATLVHNLASKRCHRFCLRPLRQVSDTPIVDNLSTSNPSTISPLMNTTPSIFSATTHVSLPLESTATVTATVSEPMAVSAIQSAPDSMEYRQKTRSQTNQTVGNAMEQPITVPTSVDVVPPVGAASSNSVPLTPRALTVTAVAATAPTTGHYNQIGDIHPFPLSDASYTTFLPIDATVLDSIRTHGIAFIALLEHQQPHSNSQSLDFSVAFAYLERAPNFALVCECKPLTLSTKEQQYETPWAKRTWQAHLAADRAHESILPRSYAVSEYAFDCILSRADPIRRFHLKDFEQNWNELFSFQRLPKDVVHGLPRIFGPWEACMIRRMDSKSVFDPSGFEVTSPKDRDQVHASFWKFNRTVKTTREVKVILNLMKDHVKCVRDQTFTCNCHKREEHHWFIPKPSPFHAVNFSLLAGHPSNLFHVLPAFSSWKALPPELKAGIAKYIFENLDFAGGITPSWYLKCNNDFFYLHVEQIFMYFANYCYEGSLVWYTIDYSQRHRLAVVLLEAILNDNSTNEFEPNTKAQMIQDLTKMTHFFEHDRQPRTKHDKLLMAVSDILQLLLLGKLFLPLLSKLVESGILVRRITQQKGNMVAGSGLVFHFGRSTLPGKNEAVNYIPLDWLRFGLPQCKSVLELFGRIEASHAFVATSPLWCGLTKVVTLQTLHFASVLFPPSFCFIFFSHLRDDIQLAIEGKRTRIPYGDLNTKELLTAKNLLDECLTLLCSESVFQYYQQAPNPTYDHRFKSNSVEGL